MSRRRTNKPDLAQLNCVISFIKLDGNDKEQMGNIVHDS
jgi:hypothetical protein